MRVPIFVDSTEDSQGWMRPRGIAQPPRLSPRRVQVVRLVTAGMTNKEIASDMSISRRTVEAHLDRVREQLGLQNRAQVAAWAVARGLVALDTA